MHAPELKRPAAARPPRGVRRLALVLTGPVLVSSAVYAQPCEPAAFLRLTDDEIERIDRVFPRCSKPRTLPMI